ncbi:aldolase/citrate lyase family protein [soil metagenome]
MSLTIPNPLADRLASGQLGVCMLIKQSRSGEIALAAKTSGYDAIYVDLEHSVISESEAAAICVTAQYAGITALVRVPSHDAHYATRLLDNGAMGIVFPHVENAEQARKCVSACRFAPLGERSVASSWPQVAYATYPAEEVRRAFNAATLVVVMLETPEAVEHADEIAAVEGVDIVHIGSSDLCEAMGLPGQLDHPKVAAAFEKVVAACRKHKKIAGVGGMGSQPETTKRILASGVRFVTAGNEWGFMISAATARASMLRKLPLD